MIIQQIATQTRSVIHPTTPEQSAGVFHILKKILKPSLRGDVMCIRQGMFFVDVQALVMNGKPLDRKEFEKGQQLARAKPAMNRSSQAPQTKSTKHHTQADAISLRTTTGGGS